MGKDDYESTYLFYPPFELFFIYTMSYIVWMLNECYSNKYILKKWLDICTFFPGYITENFTEEVLF